MANPHWVHADHLLTVTGAPEPLLTLAEAKDHLEIAHSDKDSFIAVLVGAASAMLDGHDGLVGKAVGEQTVTYSLRTIKNEKIDIPVVPTRSLESVTYYDATNTQQVIDVSQFVLVANEDFAYLEPVAGFEIPAMFDRADAITFTFLCGFAEVPEPIRHAARLMVGHWFENREAASEKSVKAIDWAVDALIGRYKIGWIGA